MKKIEFKLNNFAFKIYKMFFNVEKLFKRIEMYEIGFTGRVTAIDIGFAKEHNLKPLNKFEKWLAKPLIEFEKERRQYSFAKTMSDFLGEDINDWY